MEPLIRIDHLKKYFKTGEGFLHAVDDVSFEIYPGKTLGVVGESGCGKSTLGRLCLRLLEPTDGHIFYKGRDIMTMGRKEMHRLRQDMHIIFQDPFSSLNPRLTVFDIIAEPMESSGVHTSKKEKEERVSYLMSKVGLAERFINAYPHEMDGGRRQRVGVARALALDPGFIVCDEPVSALDVSIQAQILNLLMDLQDEMGISYMFITHDLSVVRHISNDICVMYLGQLVETSPSKELFLHPYHPYTEALLSSIPSTDIHHKRERILMKGEITSPIDPEPGCRFAARCPYASDACRKPQKLEEVSPNHHVACCRIHEIRNI